MIAGTVCHRCIEAVCREYPGGRVVVHYTGKGVDSSNTLGTARDIGAAIKIALDTGKALSVHACDELIQDPMGGFWGCSCVHEHSA